MTATSNPQVCGQLVVAVVFLAQYSWCCGVILLSEQALPKLTVHRQQASDGGRGQHSAGNSVLEQAQRQLVAISAERFRQPANQPHVAFEVVFADEHVVGTAGPYRAFFADVCADIVSHSASALPTITPTAGLEGANEAPQSVTSSLLPLFVPCPNAAMQHGDNRDKFLLKSLPADSGPTLELLQVGNLILCDHRLSGT